MGRGRCGAVAVGTVVAPWRRGVVVVLLVDVGLDGRKNEVRVETARREPCRVPVAENIKNSRRIAHNIELQTSAACNCVGDGTKWAEETETESERERETPVSAKATATAIQAKAIERREDGLVDKKTAINKSTESEKERQIDGDTAEQHEDSNL